MPEFDRIDGEFVATRCTREERFVFLRNGWVISPLRKRFVTTNLEQARAIKQFAVGAAREFIDNFEAMQRALVEESWAEQTDFHPPVPDGLAYMPFQRAGIEFAIQRKDTLIADPPGLGKTVQAVGVHNVMTCSRVLVVCPAGLKINWHREWRRWDVHGLSVGIAETVQRREKKLDTDGTPLRHPETNAVLYQTWSEPVWPDTQVIVVNYDILEKFEDQIRVVKWDLLICDEAHLLKTDTAKRTLAVLGGKVKRQPRITPINAERRLFLTGTPILSKPIELWTLVKSCDPTGLGRNWEDYAYRYCDAYPGEFGLDTSGASNEEELNQFLRERFMVRRSKESVLTELPPKRRELVLLPKDKLEKVLRKERSKVEEALSQFEAMLGLDDTDPDFRFISMIEGLGARIGAALDAQGEDPDFEKAIQSLSEPDKIMFSQIAEAREEVALAKVGMVAEHVLRLRAAGEPVILFAHHKSVVDALVEKLEKAGERVGKITGAVPVKKRQPVVDAFQDGTIDIIIGNTLAMGVGFTLTRAQHVVFAELDWVPALMEQAEDRAWRHGQKNAVHVHYLLVDGSIEVRIASALIVKMEVIFEVLDARKYV